MRRRETVVLALILAAIWSSTVLAQGRTSTVTQAQQAVRAGDKAYAAKHYKEAEAQYRRALAYDMSLVGAVENLAAIYYTQGRHQEAVTLLRSALRANSNNAHLQEWLGLHLIKLHHAAEGIRYLKAAVKQDHKLFLAQIKLGAHYLKTRQWKKTVGAFWNFLKYRPKSASAPDPVVHRLLGVAYMHLGRYPEAQTRLLRSLALRPKYARAELDLAEVYVDRGFCAPALGIFRKYRRLRNRRPRLIYLASVCYFKTKSKAQALKSITEYLRRRPNSLRGRLLLGDIHLYYKEYSHALAAFRRAVRSAPASVPAAVKYASALIGLRMYGKAIRVLETTLPRAGDNPELLEALGKAYLKTKKYAAAARYLRRLTAARPKAVAGWALQGNALFLMGKTEDAITSYRKAHALSHGKNSMARNGLVAAMNRKAGDLLKAHNRQAALALLKDAYGLDPRRLMTLRNLGLLYLLSGQPRKAVAFLERCFRKVPRDLVVNRLLGRIYLEQGQLNNARASYIRARQAAYRIGGVVLGDVQTEFAVLLARQGKLDDAISQLKQAIINTRVDKRSNLVARRDFVALSLVLGSRLLEAGKGDAALAYLEPAIQEAKGLTGTKAAMVRFLLAMAYVDVAKWGKATALFRAIGKGGVFRKVLKPPYDKLGLKFFEVYAAYRQGRYGYAATSFRKLARRAKGTLRKKIQDILRSCNEYDATNMLRSGHLKQAIASLRAAARYGGSREARHNLALALYRAGHVAKAIRMWRSGGMPPQAWCNLGAHYDNIGQPAKAYEFYKKCVARGGGGAEVRKRIQVKQKLFGFK